MIPDYYWWFLTTKRSAMRTCGHAAVSQAKRFLFESAIARNGQQSPWNIIFIISKKKYCWVIAGYCWWLLTTNPVCYADIRPCNGFAGETFFVWVRNGQEFVRNLFKAPAFYRGGDCWIMSWRQIMQDRWRSAESTCWETNAGLVWAFVITANI